MVLIVPVPDHCLPFTFDLKHQEEHFKADHFSARRECLSGHVICFLKKQIQVCCSVQYLRNGTPKGNDNSTESQQVKSLQYVKQLSNWRAEANINNVQRIINEN